MESSCSSSSYSSCIVVAALVFLIGSCSGDVMLGRNCSRSSSWGTAREANTQLAFFSLLSNAPLYGHSIVYSSDQSDSVVALAQCQGDASSAQCSACVLRAALNLRAACRRSASARVWLDLCFLRFDSAFFFGVPETADSVVRVGRRARGGEFEEGIGLLLEAVRGAAAATEKRFGWRSLSLLRHRLYAMAQCTRDLNETSCSRCLETAAQVMKDSCQRRMGCYVMNSSCRLRHEDFDFSARSAAAAAPALSPA